MRKRTLQDPYFKQAKAEGYLARSAYKLLEIDERKKLIRKGDRVLDLGCAPGSWCQAAAKLVGPKGRVVGIDLKPIDHDLGPIVTTFEGDITEFDPETLRGPIGGKRFGVVISDMAPDTTGHGDHFRSVRLCQAILERLPAWLRRGGNLTMKVFEGEAHRDLVTETNALFDEARSFKPRASRDVSRETYIVAKGYAGPVARDGEDDGA